MLSALTHGLSFVVALVACIPLLTDAYQADRFTFWCCVSLSRRWRALRGSFTLGVLVCFEGLAVAALRTQVVPRGHATRMLRELEPADVPVLDAWTTWASIY